MRVLVVHGFYRQPGGEDRYVRRQVELLSDAHEVELLARDNEGLSTARAAVTMLYSPRTVTEVEARLDRFRPDVVHVHNLYPSWGPAVHVAAARRGIPVVMTIHNYRLRCPNGIMFTEGERCTRCVEGTSAHVLAHECFPTVAQRVAYGATLPLHRHALRLEDRVAAFIAPSGFVARRLVEWGLPRGRVHEVPHPVARPPDADASVGRYGLFLGRARAEKGPDAVVEGLVAAEDPPFRFAGTGPQLDQLRRRAAAAGLRNLEFLGWVAGEDVPGLVRGARYLVMPSRFEEPAGLSALEAMAEGRPLVVSDRGALAELAGTGAALAVDPDDPSAVGTAIRSLVTDDGRCRRMGEAGMRLVASRYTEQAHVAGLEQVYASVVGAGRGDQAR